MPSSPTPDTSRNGPIHCLKFAIHSLQFISVQALKTPHLRARRGGQRPHVVRVRAARREHLVRRQGELVVFIVFFLTQRQNIPQRSQLCQSYIMPDIIIVERARRRAEGERHRIYQSERLVSSSGYGQLARPGPAPASDNVWSCRSVVRKVRLRLAPSGWRQDYSSGWAVAKAIAKAAKLRKSWRPLCIRMAAGHTPTQG